MSSSGGRAPPSEPSLSVSIRGVDESVTCDQLRLDYEVTIDVATLEDAAWGSTRMSIAGLPQGEYVAVW